MSDDSHSAHDHHEDTTALASTTAAVEAKRGATWVVGGVIAALAILFLLGALFIATKAKAKAAGPKLAAERRMAWTGAAMRRSGFKEEQIQQALTKGGTVHAWGWNAMGECTVPPGLTNVVAIAGGSGNTTALKADGTVVKWGGVKMAFLTSIIVSFIDKPVPISLPD